MHNNTSSTDTWSAAQARAAVPGSPILTNWRAEREAARAAGMRNEATVTYDQSVLDAFGVGRGAAGITINAVSAMRVSAVAACVQLIAGAISSLPLEIYTTDGETPVRAPRDALWYLLNEQPSPQYTAASHWEVVSMGEMLRGDAFTWIIRSVTGKIVEFRPMPWSAVTPQLQSDGSVRYYLHYQGRSTWIEPADMLHFPGFGFDGIKGMSVISNAARNAAGNAMAMDEYSGKFFANGAHPSIILKASGKMGKDQIDALQQAFANKYSGADNFHRLPMVLTEGLDAKEISLSAEDAQLLEARKFQVIDIARAFGVPPHMIGETSSSTSWGSGIEAMSRGFVQYTLQTHLQRIEQELNRKLWPNRAGRYVRFNREALIEGDSKAQADYNRAALGGPGSGQGWMTVDEIRRTKGLPPLGGAAGRIFDPREASAKPAAEPTPGEPTP
jgi:HK97 family phage portal protein